MKFRLIIEFKDGQHYEFHHSSACAVNVTDRKIKVYRLDDQKTDEYYLKDIKEFSIYNYD